MVTRPEIPVPEDYGPKEVYSFFGLASYMAQVMEKGLQILAVALQLSGVKKITREIVEELFENMETKTCGQLITICKEEGIFSGTDSDKIGNALKKRNWLIHHYFYDNAEEFYSFNGRSKMISELQEMISLFDDTDHIVHEIGIVYWEKHGLTQEIIERELNNLINRSKNKYGAI